MTGKVYGDLLNKKEEDGEKCYEHELSHSAPMTEACIFFHQLSPAATC